MCCTCRAGPKNPIWRWSRCPIHPHPWKLRGQHRGEGHHHLKIRPSRLSHDHSSRRCRRTRATAVVELGLSHMFPNYRQATSPIRRCRTSRVVIHVSLFGVTQIQSFLLRNFYRTYIMCICTCTYQISNFFENLNMGFEIFKNLVPVSSEATRTFRNSRVSPKFFLFV